MIGCCNSFKKCSDEAKCIYEERKDEHDRYWEQCSYRRNLAKGLNFYTPYNEKNAANKKAYEEQLQEKERQETKQEPVKSKQDEDLTGYDTYININGRYFSIGRRSKYNGFTVYLEGEVKANLISILENKGISCTDAIAQFTNEKWSDDNPAWYRPILSIAEEKYNISTYNYRALTDDTAKAIRGFFNRAGFEVMIETLGRKTAIAKSRINKKTIQSKKEAEVKLMPRPTPKEKDVHPQQISFLDMNLF